MDEQFVEPFIEHQGERGGFWLRKPRPIGKTLLLARAKATIPPRTARDRTIIFLNLGGVFGTGGHGTTQGCLLALEEHLRPGQVVLDAGTGSGILAVAAAKLGAARVIAADISPAACRQARANALLNGVGRVVKIIEGPAEIVEGKFALVVANLRTPTLAAILSPLVEKVDEGGLLILSGILEREFPSFLSLLKGHFLDLLDGKKASGWVTLVVRRPAGAPQAKVSSGTRG